MRHKLYIACKMDYREGGAGAALFDTEGHLLWWTSMFEVKTKKRDLLVNLLFETLRVLPRYGNTYLEIYSDSSNFVRFLFDPTRRNRGKRIENLLHLLDEFDYSVYTLNKKRNTTARWIADFALQEGEDENSNN